MAEEAEAGFFFFGVGHFVGEMVVVVVVVVEIVELVQV